MTKELEIENVLNQLRPAMEADGGGVDLVSIENGIVNVKLKGTCLACPSAGLTIKLGLEQTIKKELPWVEKVVRL